MHAQSWFGTLTYDDAHAPADGGLHYGDFQLFVRRLRRALNPRSPRALPRSTRQKIRYFVAGEYGSQNLRPHWHCALFGVDFPDLARLRKSPSGFTLWNSPTLASAWGKGFTSLGRLSFQSAAYMASYICKKATGVHADAYKRVDLETGEVRLVRPEFARMSLRPAIGKTWFDRFASDCLPRDYCVVDGRKIPVPRYYSDLFKARDAFAYDELEHSRIERAALSVSERTPERLATREKVALAAAALKSRKL